jgi:Fe-S cluster biosynthesis and repair protein YggX
MAMISCSRCGRSGENPPPHRVPFTGPDKERILASICSDCWKLWEDMEVKVINEYRLSFLDAEHRGFLQRTCTDFLFQQKAAAGIPE